MRDDLDGGETGKTKTTAKKNIKKNKTKVKISAIDSLRDSIDLTSLPSAKNNKKILSGNKTRNRKDSMTFAHGKSSKSNSIAESNSVTKKGVAMGKIETESDDDNITLKHESQKDSIVQQ